jgi:transposase
VRPARPMAPGKLRRPDYEYKRCGTANVFCAVEPKAGKHFTLATPNRKAPQLAQALETIVASYPAARTIHLVMDNLNIHGPKTLTDHFGKEKGTALWNRFTVHYTPKHGSWLNQAEIGISLFARQCLARRRIPSLAALQRESEAWNAKENRDCTKINWQFTRKKARQKFSYKRSQKNRFIRS